MSELEELLEAFHPSFWNLREEPPQITYSKPPAETSDDKDEDAVDPSFLEKMDALSIPSLYDFLVTQEKLAAEIRRQNRALRAMNQAISQMKETIMHIDNRLDETEGQLHPQSPSVDESARILMKACDAMWHLIQSSRETARVILSLAPQKNRFWRSSKPTWRRRLEEVLAGYVEGIEILEEKTMTSLSDLGIVRILPQINTPFDPLKHKVIKTISGENSGKVAEVIQCGYLKDGELLRFAEVSIY